MPPSGHSCRVGEKLTLQRGLAHARQLVRVHIEAEAFLRSHLNAYPRKYVVFHFLVDVAKFGKVL